MKKGFYFLITLLLVNSSNLCSKNLEVESSTNSPDSMKVFCSPDLYKLSTAWADEYNKLYPDTKIKVLSVQDTRLNGSLLQNGSIGFISDGYYSGFENDEIQKTVVARDVIVPVFNTMNPNIAEISRKGVSTEALIRYFSSRESQTWGKILNTNSTSQVHYYWISDGSMEKGLSAFLITKVNNPGGVEVKTEESMISSIQKDPIALGFCKMISIVEAKNRGLAENVSLLPIDRNGNGIIDYNENFYNDLNAFSRGVWIGKYPKTLVSNIYSVSYGQLKSETELNFMKWILTNGQQYLYGNGYSDLLVTERQSTIDKLYEASGSSVATVNDKSRSVIIFIIVGTILLIGFIVNPVLSYVRQGKKLNPIEGIIGQPVLNENTLIVPKGIYFDKTHTWAFMEQNGVVRVGIDDFLQHITGQITRIKMKNVGDQIKKGEKLLTVMQNGKQLNLYAPVSGTIREQNNILEKNSSLINSSPYDEGWIYKIDPENWGRENQLLFMGEKEKLYIKNEFSRLRDFLAETLSTGSEEYAQVVLQDGGEQRDGTLSYLGPEVWEDFQTKFIDPSRQIWFYELF